MYLERTLTDRLRELFRHFPVVVVSGARQVGKTTLLARVFKGKADLVTFDPHFDIEGARSDPDLFLANRRHPLILDEVQYVPELLGALKRRVDSTRRPGMYLLTGSQQWSVMRGLADSLAGRAVFLDLEGLSLQEIAGKGKREPWLGKFLADPWGFCENAVGRPAPKSPVGIWEQLWRGWLPEAQTLPLNLVPEFHAGYLRTYVERDARQMAETSDWKGFATFFRLLGALTAQEINFSQLGREIGLNPQTAKRWLGILTGTFQWFELPAFSRNAVKRLSNRPKGYLADTGLACFGQSVTTPTALGANPLWGRIFETAVAAELRKQIAALPSRPTLRHWRSHGGAEVDFLLEADGTFFPIEAKAGSHPDGSAVPGLQAFRQTYPNLDIGPGLILAPTERCYRLTQHDFVLPGNFLTP